MKSSEQIGLKMHQHNPGSKTNKVIGAVIVIKLVVTSYFSCQFVGSWINYYQQTANTYPTSLPWVSTKTDCEHRGKEWRNEKCWDSEHSMLF
ncbi:hypothetical protein [Dulcicalothrix desertica]|uniref:hypothetical protein n=1 Tax=Dulcicalothrix desertica TaxID=32056 RepID=UPI001F386EE4|nr:hypothetical protein [Dulcicalothrix desertica]